MIATIVSPRWTHDVLADSPTQSRPVTRMTTRYSFVLSLILHTILCLPFFFFFFKQSDEDDDEPPPPEVDISSISFGALARAQASLPVSTRKRKVKSSPGDVESHNDGDDDNRRQDYHRQKQDKEKPKPPKRSSKHAPHEQSSKRPVSRLRRDIGLDDPSVAKRASVRDPRFDAFSSSSTSRLDEIKARKAYAFIHDIKDKELADLRARLRKTKDETARATLKREILSMESKRKARQKKDEEERVMAEHKKKEKELVAQGKNPFYLKRSEQKRRLLTSRFEAMGKGQVDRAMERRRKKVAGRERKELDMIQRVTERRQRSR